MQDPFSDDLMAHVVYEKIWLFFSRFAKKNRAKNAQYIMGSKRYEVPSEFYITQQIVLNFFNSKLYKIQIFFAREQSFLELNLNLTQLRIEKM